MAVLKVKLPDGTWADIASTGTQGPSGGPVPVGGNPGEVIQKTGPNDMEVGWTVRPRVALNVEVAQVTSSATVNAMTLAVGGDVRIDPERTYHIIGGWRCIQDPGAVIATAHARMAVGTVNLPAYDEVTTADTGLWGAWSQNVIRPGSTFAAAGAGPVTLDARLEFGCTIASKIFYSPRLYIIEM